MNKPLRNLSVGRFTCAIIDAESMVSFVRAQLIGQRIRNEDGVKFGVDLIERYAAEFR